jgi:putative ABC transport system permease protein
MEFPAHGSRSSTVRTRPLARSITRSAWLFVSATRRDRVREGVLLKTLGATRRQIVRIMLSEYALLGGLGAFAGVMLSTAGAWGLMRIVFKQPFIPALIPMAIVALAMMGISVAIGLLTGREVFSETPMAALRDA